MIQAPVRPYELPEAKERRMLVESKAPKCANGEYCITAQQTGSAQRLPADRRKKGICGLCEARGISKPKPKVDKEPEEDLRLRRYCKKEGHDTWKTGRLKDGNCAECRRERERKRQERLRQNVPPPPKEVYHDLCALKRLKEESGNSWSRLAKEAGVSESAMKHYGSYGPKRHHRAPESSALKIAEALTKLLGRHVGLEELKGEQ